jgi:hypothetical protein
MRLFGSRIHKLNSKAWRHTAPSHLEPSTQNTVHLNTGAHQQQQGSINRTSPGIWCCLPPGTPRRSTLPRSTPSPFPSGRLMSPYPCVASRCQLQQQQLRLYIWAPSADGARWQIHTYHEGARHVTPVRLQTSPNGTRWQFHTAHFGHTRATLRRPRSVRTHIGSTQC